MRTVMIVDQLEFKRKLMARAFVARGYAVIEFGCAMEAIRAYADVLPDVVVLHHALPDLDGVTALKAFRVVDPHARVILTGPVVHPTPVLEAKRAGALDFIAQPLSGDRLMHAVGRHLSPVVA